MARVLVTGANGHIGANTVRQLLTEGHEVVGFVRETADLRSLEDVDLQIARGDIRDGKAVHEAMAGCDHVIHHAAVYAMRNMTAEEIIEPSMQGVKHVLAAAKAHSVKRVVHTSSLAAVGYEDRQDGPVRTAASWNDQAKAPYYVAKTEAERQALKLAEELEVPLVSCCPGGVLGGYDYRITPTTKVVLDMASGTGSSGAGGLGLVDVRDVALCHIRAMTEGPSGARYLVSGENVPLRTLGEIVGGLTGKAVPYIPMPRWAIGSVVPLMEGAFRLFGKEPIVTVDEATEVIGRWPTFDCSDTEEALGVTFRGAQEAVESSLAWLVHTGALPEKVSAKLAPKLSADPAWPVAA